MHGIGDMKIEANREELLAKLKANRDAHKKIVEEARAGYIEKAKKALDKKMKALEAGEFVHLSFSLEMPQDHTREYDTHIKMLEMHQGKTVSLTSSLVRCFVEDEWGWKSHFIGVAANYSQTAAAARNDGF